MEKYCHTTEENYHQTLYHDFLKINKTPKAKKNKAEI